MLLREYWCCVGYRLCWQYW